MTDLTSAAREFYILRLGSLASMEIEDVLADFAKTYAESRTAELVAALKDAREAMTPYARQCDRCGCVDIFHVGGSCASVECVGDLACEAFTNRLADQIAAIDKVLKDATSDKGGDVT